MIVAEVKLEYIRKLINRIGQEGVDDNALMDRIEKLLAETKSSSCPAALAEAGGTDAS